MSLRRPIWKALLYMAAILLFLQIGKTTMRTCRMERLQTWLDAHSSVYPDVVADVMPTSKRIALVGEVSDERQLADLTQTVHSQVGRWVYLWVRIKGAPSPFDVPAEEYLRGLK